MRVCETTLARPARGLPCALLLALLFASGCGPRLRADPVFESDDYYVALRRTVDGSEVVPRGYSHPVTISDVRLAHVLANLEYQDAEGRRRPVIRSIHVYPLAEALNQAIAKAGPEDEIVATALSTDRRLGFFTEERLTAFRLFFVADVLNLEFFDIELELQPGDGKPGRDDRYDLPTELPEGSPRFRLLPGPKHLASGRSVQVEWRDPYFAQPVSLSVRGDRLRRRTVIMESDPVVPEESEEVDLGDVPPELRDAQIRALDQLDALRRQGLIKEIEFRRRRSLILQGKLDEAGYEPAP